MVQILIYDSDDYYYFYYDNDNVVLFCFFLYHHKVLTLMFRSHLGNLTLRVNSDT